jgi:GT2 family glycosyltransferase
MVGLMVTVSVVVPATDDPPTLERCLAALAASDDRPDEVVVVRRPTGLSAAGARNQGACRATGAVLLFVDADVEVHPDAVGRVRRAFAEPDLTALFGSYDDAPDDGRTVSAFRNLLHHHVHHHGAGQADTFWTGLGAVRRDAFEAAGGFDAERFPHPSVEDIDFGTRLASAGATVRLDPTIQGTHLKRWTLRSMVWTDLARRGVPWVALQLRQRRMASTLNCGWRHRLSALCSVGVVAGLVAGSLVAGIAALAGLLGLNLAFYALLVRRLGPVAAAVGVLLHGLHHLVAVASVPLGVLSVALSTTRRLARQVAGQPAVLAAGADGARAS